ncbi:MAG: PSD1 and planctomycete cytochrome C domain-containing protein [Gemmataceae bacterium]|nr:PSD1 and planctomycete cytochrome C domain-containing protein [Gemmataceae bacterium]
MRWLLALGLAPIGLTAAAADPTPGQVEFFENKVRPVLAEKCYSCHGPKKQSAGLRLDTADGLAAGADDGPVVAPGDPANSRLIASVGRTGDYPMPPKHPLAAGEVATLTEWVKQGAVFPKATAAQVRPDAGKHWAFQPVKPVPVPAIRNPQSAIRNEIDRFVLARLEREGMKPAPPADGRTLIRRAYYDLVGLPPTAAEVEAFAADNSPDAWEKLIDKLLASPQYGERWGRYWLDVARYADTKGYVFQEERAFPYAYTYRDYVVRSFNEDKPYDRFILEQLAADKLDLGDDKRPLAAMGFLTLGRRFLNSTPDIIDDRIDVVARGLMGLTVGCARCHDHKFDPVPIADYYSLYGVFASSEEPKELPLIGGDGRTTDRVEYEVDLAEQEAGYAAEVARRHAAAVAKLRTPEVVVDYLAAVVDARGKTNEQVQALLRQRDLNRLAFDRWRDYVADRLKAGKPPVFAQLADPKDVRAAAKRVAERLTDPPKDRPDLKAVLGAGGPTDIPLADAQKLFNRLDRDQLRAARRKIDGFIAASPAAPPRAHVLSDLPKPFDPYVFLRGNPNNRGPAVPRRFVSVAAGPDRKPFAGGSGRLELAKAIASPDNPLTARVMANRVWLGHFGQGLVRTPSDFGTRADPPTHPEMLDWLAARFVADGWSVKKLHRVIMLSATYRQASLPATADIENKLLGRQNRRRLDFEALRDSLLVAAGRLDSAPGGRPVELFEAPYPTRRTVYGLIDRSNLPGTFRVFDVASPDQHSPQRFQTTVPPQALYLLNSPFVAEQARAAAARPEVAGAKSDGEKVAALYRAVLGRDPSAEERALGAAFAAGEVKGDFGPWPQLAQVLMLSNEFAFAD